MKKNQNYWAAVVNTILGTVLVGLGFAGVIDDFWSSMGSILLVLGIVRWIRFYRFSKNEGYRQKIEVEMSDERNHFIRNKAWAWAGYIFVITLGIAVIVFKVIGQDLLSYAASIAVCFMLCLFWISYYILRRKY